MSNKTKTTFVVNDTVYTIDFPTSLTCNMMSIYNAWHSIGCVVVHLKVDNYWFFDSAI